MTLNRILAVLLSLVAAIATSAHAADGEQDNPHASVHEIRAALDSIHPYLPKAQVSSEIDIFGSTSMDSLAHGWAVGFKKFHPSSTVVISAEGSETVFDRLAEKPESIGMLSRPVTQEDLLKLKEKGLKRPVAVMVAREALGIFVNDSNPVNSISYPQLVKLFCGEHGSEPPTWGSVGVTGDFAKQSVVLVGRENNSGTHTFIKDFIFRGLNFRDSQTTFESNTDVIGAVEKDPHAIAITGLKSGAHGAKSLHLILNKAAIPSDDHSILVGHYPLTRPMTLVLDVGRNDKTAIANREFVRYALGQGGQMQAILSGFFPFDPPLLRGQLHKIDGQDNETGGVTSPPDPQVPATATNPVANPSR